MERYKKVLIKVYENKTISRVHFSYVSKRLYDKFLRLTGIQGNEIAAYIAVWAKEDFGLNLSMTNSKDVKLLCDTINKQCKREYEDLYRLTPEENPSVRGWVKLWISKHIRLEIANCEITKQNQS